MRLVFEAMVIQVLPLKRCNEMVFLDNGEPLEVSLPVIKKDCLILAEEDAKIVRVVKVVELLAGVAVTVVLRDFASTQGATLQNSKTVTINVTKKTIKSFFSIVLGAQSIRQ